MTQTTPARPPRLAPEAAMMRLLLQDPRFDPDDVDWAAMLDVAESHGLLLRLADWFVRRHEVVPGEIGTRFVEAQRRLSNIEKVVREITERCAHYGVEHVFLRVAQQYPDVSRDVDLLLSGPRADVESVLAPWAAGRIARPLRRRLSATTCYELPDCDAVLEVHDGRLGRLGEHRALAGELLQRRNRLRLGGLSWNAPAADDALLLEALYRLYGRPALRLRDALWTITTIRQERIDWMYLLDAAQRHGLLAGVSCYLDYAEQIHQQLLGDPLIRSDVRRHLASGAWGTWGRVKLTAGGFQFPAARVTGRLYFDEFCADIAQGHWAAARRLCLLPLLAADAGVRRLAPGNR